MDKTIKELSNNEIKCVKCGSDKFKLFRPIPEQIALSCIKCDYPHLLNTDMLEEKPVITFWTEKELD